MSLRRAEALRKRRNFHRVREKGNAFVGRNILISIYYTGLKKNFFACITPKRLGSAVCRNHFRRQLRHINAHYKRRLKTGHYIVAIVRKNALLAPYPSLEKEYEKLLKRARLL